MCHSAGGPCNARDVNVASLGLLAESITRYSQATNGRSGPMPRVGTEKSALRHFFYSLSWSGFRTAIQKAIVKRVVPWEWSPSWADAKQENTTCIDGEVCSPFLRQRVVGAGVSKTEKLLS